LTHEPSELESPDWHRDTLAARKNMIDEGKAEFIPLDALRLKR
jgi:hypothetical protein